ncbi:MAG TPA: folate-binding protein [Mizugakiibacter sp.]
MPVDTVPATDLGPAEILLIEGSDASAFAHAQFSSDVRALDVGRWQWSTWLDAQGRVRALMHLGRVDAARYVALLRGGVAAALADALRRYVFRSKVTLTPLPAGRLVAGPAFDMHALRADGETLVFGLGARSLEVTSTSGKHDAAGADAFRLADIHAAWPWLPPPALDAYVPQTLGLDQLGAIAWDKGCYPGQEIVARLRYRGGLKRNLRRIGSAVSIVSGATVMHAGQPCGTVLNTAASASGSEALVVLHHELPSDASLQIDGMPAVLLQPPVN